MLALIILGAVLWFFNNAFHPATGPASSGTAQAPAPSAATGYQGIF